MGKLFRGIFGGGRKKHRSLPDLPDTPPEPLPLYADVTLGMNVSRLGDRELAQLQLLGMRHIRITGILPLWETGGYRDFMVAVDQRARLDGLKVLWVLHNIPPGEYFRTPLTERWRLMERMAIFAGWTASLPSTEGVQLWNEADEWHQAPFGAHEGLDPVAAGRLYAEQLSLAELEMVKMRPECLLVAQGIADHPSGRGLKFLRGMLEQRPPFDILARHAYGHHGRTRGLAVQARELARELGAFQTLWFTEFGNNQGCDEPFSEEAHLEAMRSNVEGFKAEPLVRRLYWYTLATDPSCPTHGLFHYHAADDMAGPPRSAYQWLRGHQRGRV